MPSPSEILGGLKYIANAWSTYAIVWHGLIGAALTALVVGWRPTRRQAGVLLVLPLLSVSIFAARAGNPFNATLFAAAAIVLGAISARLADLALPRPSRAAAMTGIAMIAFGWIYPHFLDGPALRYLYAAPVGLIPCPTLSVVVGFALLAGGLGSRAWALVLASTGLFYGLFGAIRLGVRLDAGLIAGAAVLAVVALRRAASRDGDSGDTKA
jgi:hypothetical protein